MPNKSGKHYNVTKKAPPTKAEVEKAKKGFVWNLEGEMRQQGEQEPLVLLDFSKADSELLPTSGMKMRELTEQNHQAWLAYKFKQASRKVKTNVKQKKTS